MLRRCFHPGSIFRNNSSINGLLQKPVFQGIGVYLTAHLDIFWMWFELVRGVALIAIDVHSGCLKLGYSKIHWLILSFPLEMAWNGLFNGGRHHFQTRPCYFNLWLNCVHLLLLRYPSRNRFLAPWASGLFEYRLPNNFNLIIIITTTTTIIIIIIRIKSYCTPSKFPIFSSKTEESMLAA